MLLDIVRMMFGTPSLRLDRSVKDGGVEKKTRMSPEDIGEYAIILVILKALRSGPGLVVTLVGSREAAMVLNMFIIPVERRGFTPGNGFVNNSRTLAKLLPFIIDCVMSGIIEFIS